MQCSRRRRRRVRGAVAVEYAVLLVMIGLPVFAGVTLGGAALLKNYRETRSTVLSPMP